MSSPTANDTKSAPDTASEDAQHSASAAANPASGEAPATTAGNVRSRANVKGKHLMRSQALREATSPPRAPETSPSAVATVVASTHNNHKAASSSAASLSPSSSSENASNAVKTGTVLKTCANILDQEFPKLAQSKTKFARASAQTFKCNTSSMANGDIKKTLSPCSANSPHQSRSNSNEKAPSDEPAPGEYEQGKTTNERNKKNRGHGGADGGGGIGSSFKPRLKNMGSSAEEYTAGGYLLKDDSVEYTDWIGIDLLQFFTETLRKTPRDRNMLLRIEQDLIALATDRSRQYLKFPPTSSYNRMLIHRTAAYFGMEHNVDAAQQSIVVEVTKSTRIPEIRFESLISDDEPRKSILKRDCHSFDEYRRGVVRNADRPHEYRPAMLGRKTKSFDERDETDRTKIRSFRKRDNGADNGPASHDPEWNGWGGSDGSPAESGHEKSNRSNRLLKVQSLSIDNKSNGRPPVTKAHSFGGYGPAPSSAYKAQTTTTWRLSPSSSGYKTQSQSIRSDSVTPSPTGYESGNEHTPEHGQPPPPPTCGVVWAVTDMASVPLGSMLIDPQTLQPIVNQDGSIYQFDPNNLPFPSRLLHLKPATVIEAEELIETPDEIYSDEPAASIICDSSYRTETDIQVAHSPKNEPMNEAELSTGKMTQIDGRTSQMCMNNTEIDQENVNCMHVECDETDANNEQSVVEYTESIISADAYVQPYQQEVHHNMYDNVTGEIQYYSYTAEANIEPPAYAVQVYEPDESCAANRPDDEQSETVGNQQSDQHQEQHSASRVVDASCTIYATNAADAMSLVPMPYAPHLTQTGGPGYSTAPAAPVMYAGSAALDAVATQSSIPQYVTVPVGYPYAYNDHSNYWQNPMTYYVPSTHHAASANVADPSVATALHTHASYPMHHHLQANGSTPNTYTMSGKHAVNASQPIAIAPYAAASAFNASLAYGPGAHPPGVFPFIAGASAADPGAMLKGLYPIPQPIYMNFVHQSYHQQHHTQSHNYAPANGQLAALSAPPPVPSSQQQQQPYHHPRSYSSSAACHQPVNGMSTVPTSSSTPSPTAASAHQTTPSPPSSASTPPQPTTTAVPVSASNTTSNATSSTTTSPNTSVKYVPSYKPPSGAHTRHTNYHQSGSYAESSYARKHQYPTSSSNGNRMPPRSASEHYGGQPYATLPKAPVSTAHTYGYQRNAYSKPNAPKRPNDVSASSSVNGQAPMTRSYAGASSSLIGPGAIPTYRNHSSAPMSNANGVSHQHHQPHHHLMPFAFYNGSGASAGNASSDTKFRNGRTYTKATQPPLYAGVKIQQSAGSALLSNSHHAPATNNNHNGQTTPSAHSVGSANSNTSTGTNGSASTLPDGSPSNASPANGITVTAHSAVPVTSGASIMGASPAMTSLIGQHPHQTAQMCYGQSNGRTAIAAAAAMANAFPGNSSGGMYAFFHPTLSFANHHQQQHHHHQQQSHHHHQNHQRARMYTDAKDTRTQIGHALSDILPSMNTMLIAPRIMNARSSNSNYQGRNPRPR